MPRSTRITYELWIDWNDDLIIDPDELISDDLRHISFSYGRENNDTLGGRSSGGQCDVLLSNRHGNYSIFKRASPYHDYFTPGKAVQVAAYVEGFRIVLWTGFLKTIVPHVSVDSSAHADLIAVGSLTWIDQAKFELFYHLDTQESVLPSIIPRANEVAGGDLIALILNLIDWKGYTFRDSRGFIGPSRHVNLTPGPNGIGIAPRQVPGPFGRNLAIGHARFDAQAIANDEAVSGGGNGTRVRAIRTIRAVEALELGFVREDNLGSIVFEDRRHRLEDMRTGPLFTDLASSLAGGATFPYNPLDLESYDGSIYNIIASDQVKYYYKAESQVADVIPGKEDEKGLNPPLLVPAGTTIEKVYGLPTVTHVGVETGAPAYVWPWKAVTVADRGTYDNDPRLQDPEDGGSLIWDLNTSVNERPGTGFFNRDIRVVTEQGARSVRLTITNTNPTRDLYITRLRLRGFPHYPQGSVRAYATNEPSIAKYFPREYQVPTSLSYIRNIGADAESSSAFAEVLAEIYGTPRPSGRLTLHPRYSAAMAMAVLSLQISDPIRVRNEAYGLTGGFGQLGHRFFIESMKHDIEPGVSHAVEFGLSSYQDAQEYWILGVSELGTNTRLYF